MLRAAVLAALFAVRGAFAADPGAEEDDDEVLSAHTLGGASVEAAVPAALPEPPPVTVALAAAALGSDPAKLEATRAGLELVYQRRYKEARRAFDTLSTRYPTSGLGPAGVVVLYQALMFENFDFRYEGPYDVSLDAADAQLAAGAKLPGDEALEAFLGAGLAGIDAIHSVRKGAYLPAIERALVAMARLGVTKERAPAFADVALADGMYLYWRSVLSKAAPMLPAFPDQRAQGLAALRSAEANAVFLGPAATLAIAYAAIEERKLPEAVQSCQALRLRYPDNVVNNMTLGRVFTSQRRYADALRMYDEVLVDDPTNQRTHYFRGLVLARLGRHEEAVAAYKRYVAFREVPTALRSQAFYRLGTEYERLKDPRKAEQAYTEAVKAGGNEAARKALERQRSSR